MAKKRVSTTLPPEAFLPKSPKTSLTPYQREAWEIIDNHALVALAGAAGTGKTYTAIAWATEAIKNKEYDELVVVRSPLEAGRSRMGFLPGDASVEGKMAPWAVPIRAIIKQLRVTIKDHYLPPCYLQGYTFKKSIVVVDECQCLTLEEFEMVASRLATDSKIIFAGDQDQDTRGSNGFLPFLDIIQGIPGCGRYDFPDDANCRHPIVRAITRKIKEYRAR